MFDFLKRIVREYGMGGNTQIKGPVNFKELCLIDI